MSTEQYRAHVNPHQPWGHRSLKDSGAVGRLRRDGRSSAKAFTERKSTTSSDRRGQFRASKRVHRDPENSTPRREVPYQVAGLCTPPATSTSPSEAGTESVIIVHSHLEDHPPSVPPLEDNPRDIDDDDVASQGSMRTWTGERDGENLQNARTPGTVLFNYDPHDSTSDPPPIPWEQVQSYTDFLDNKEAHAYWKWDPTMVMWTHTDADTGEVVFCPSELD